VRQIHAITGVRIVAAVWVILFHLRGNIASEFPRVYDLIGPIIIHGDYGVDLFFIVSGYVIALNYADRMGIALDRKASVKFWWARIARIWPAYFLTLLFCAVWHGSFLIFHANDPVAPRDFSVLSFFRQALLIVQWTEPDSNRLTWNGAAWTVSAESLAYVIFPVIALLLFRLGRAFGARALGVMGAVVVSPVVLFALALGSIYAPYMWLLRILCEFLAGCLLYYALSKVELSSHLRWVASILACAVVVLFVGFAYLIWYTGHERWGVLVVPLMFVLVGCLAVGDRLLPRLLAMRWFVVGGMASYSVYLVHMPIIEVFWFLQGHVSWVAPGSVGSKVGFILLPFIALAAGYCLWRFFEEPARRAMRRMSLQHIPERAADDVVPSEVKA
jgi:peptidoglycan/LPS O-acetylase OafA/YrhL